MVISRREKVKLIIFLFLAIGSLLALPFLFFVYEDIETFLLGAGILGPLIYISVMIIAIVVSAIPASPLAIIAGAIYGPWLGMLYTLIGATLGAMLAFLIARYFLRESVGSWVEKQKFYSKFRGKNNRNILGAIFATRLMPYVSFDIVSYASGITSISIWSFAAVTFVGMIPIVFLLSFFGFLVRPYLLIVFGLLLFVFVGYILYLIFKSKSTNKRGFDKKV